MIKVPLNRITANPWQTRLGEPDPEYIESLALDIAQNGLLQLPVGRLWNGDWSPPLEQFDAGTWDMKLHEGNNLVVQLAFGHNRLAAYRWLAEQDAGKDDKAGYDVMPVEIRQLDDQQMAILAWSENEQRRDVSPIERAKAIERRMADFDWNQHEVADQLGVARPTVSNVLRLLKLPERIQDALNDGRISARVGSALLPIYDLPEHILKIANEGWYHRPSQIETEALGGASSDAIRKDVDLLYQRLTCRLQDAEFKLEDVFGVGETVLGYDHDHADGLKIYNSACTDCDRRIKDRGNICTDKACYLAKQTLHRRAYLEKAAKTCGIPAVDPNKGGQVTHMPYNDEKAQKIIDSKCENLRLMWTESKLNHSVQGHPHALIVCDKRNGSCSCAKGLDLAERKGITNQVSVIEADDDDDYAEEYPLDEGMTEEVRAQTSTDLSPKDLEEITRQARRDKAEVASHIGEAREKIFKVLFDGFRTHNPGAYHLAATKMTWAMDGDLVLEKIYRRMANDAVDLIMPSSSVIASSSLVRDKDDLYENINDKLTRLGLDPVYPYERLVEVFDETEN